MVKVTVAALDLPDKVGVRGTSSRAVARLSRDIAEAVRGLEREGQ